MPLYSLISYPTQGTDLLSHSRHWYFISLKALIFCPTEGTDILSHSRHWSFISLKALIFYLTQGTDLFIISRYGILILVLTYILPMICMGVTYTRVGILLWGSRGVGERTAQQWESMKAKRKVGAKSHSWMG